MNGKLYAALDSSIPDAAGAGVGALPGCYALLKKVTRGGCIF